MQYNAIASQNKINSEVFDHKTTYLPSSNQKACDEHVGCRTIWNPQSEYYDKVMPIRPDSFTRDRLPSTEIFGGVFKQRGDGELLNPHEAATIRMGAKSVEACKKKIMERQFYRSQCVDFPLAYELSYGIDTRQGDQQFFCK